MDILSEFQQMDSNLMAWFTIIMFIMLGFVFGMFFIIIIDKDKGYEQGQIDAVNGKINYELKENKDKELVWVEKNKTSKK